MRQGLIIAILFKELESRDGDADMRMTRLWGIQTRMLILLHCILLIQSLRENESVLSSSD